MPLPSHPSLSQRFTRQGNGQEWATVAPASGRVAPGLAAWTMRGPNGQLATLYKP